jgi:MFS superfamily sulfate permease-like transporter
MFPEPPLKRNLSADLRSSLVVFLVALPLCLGIALASGAPAFAGIIAGIIGGIVVGLLSGSRISVSGPAAGLTVVVLDSIKSLGAYEAFLLAVFLSGIIQVLLGLLKAGKMTNYFPSAVIKGMLASIGLILIFKQLPHALGYDFDYSGDESFFESDGHNTFTDIYFAFLEPAALAIVISISSLLLMILWDTYAGRFSRFGKLVPGALLAVVSGTTINLIALSNFPELALMQEHLVALPTDLLKGGFSEMMKFPDFSQILNPKVYQIAFTIAVIGSIESLLSIEASDKLDPDHQITPTNKELIAQGSGNILSGLLGGIPVTAVIVRSSANLLAGAKSRYSAVFHGVLLLVSVVLIPTILNKIPLSALAAVLLIVGYKLTKPSVIKEIVAKGPDQYIPFAVTVIAILFSDLLIGISIGFATGLLFILKSNLKKAVVMVHDGTNYLIQLRHNVSFINKSILRDSFSRIPDGSYLIIDGTSAIFIDTDIIETIENFCKSAPNKYIQIEIKKSESSIHPFFRK